MTTASDNSVWDPTFHANENAAAILWLLDNGLIDDTGAREAAAQRVPLAWKSKDIRYVLSEYDVTNRQRVGNLLLSQLGDLDAPVRDRAFAVRKVVEEWVRPGSEVATVAQAIEEHYEPGAYRTAREADDAALVQLQSIANTARAHRAFESFDRGRTLEELGDHVRYGFHWPFVVGPIVVAAVVMWISTTPVVEDGSGWIPLLRIGSVILVAIAMWMAVRRPGVVLTPARFEFRGLVRSRVAAWSDVLDVDVDHAEHHGQGSWLFGPREVELVAVTIRNVASPGGFDRVRFGSGGRSALAVHDEIVAFAREHGADLSEWPDVNRAAWWQPVVAFICTIAVLYFMSSALGICRYGKCGEGWLVERLETKTDGSDIEDTIVDGYASDDIDVEVTCPETVPTDQVFYCDIDGLGIPGYDRLRVRTVGPTHGGVEWKPVHSS